MHKARLRTLELGPTLYIPATHPALADVGNLRKYPTLRCLVYCTEDSVLERDLPRALANLEATLPLLEDRPVRRFIRPRNPEVLERILRFKGLEHITGFVLPKVDLRTFPAYEHLLRRQEDFSIMLTLETKAVFDITHIHRLRDSLSVSSLQDRILALRIGAQDLLSILGLRREPGVTIYETPLGCVIDQIITLFHPAGFALAAPSCEYFNAPDLLLRELRADVARGLFAKTALHPEQMPLIESAYRVSAYDLKAAKAINDPQRPAVFRLDDRMCEKAVHSNWAEGIEIRASLYGVREADE